MKKTTALKLLGILVICLGGRLMESENKELKADDLHLVWEPNIEPMDFVFVEKSIRNLIITTDDEDIVIPFSDIVEALKDDKNL